MFLQLGDIRNLIHRYLRRHVGDISSVDAGRLTRKLEARVAQDLQGPVTRAIVHNSLIDIARRYGVPTIG